MKRVLIGTTLVMAGVLATSLVAFAGPQEAGRAPSIDKVNGGITAEAGQRYGDLSTVNGGITLGRGTYSKDVETVNGGIFMDRGSQVRGDISAVNGGIGIVGTAVGGRIETVNGDISVGADSRVTGGIKVEKQHGSFGGWFGKPKIPRIVIGPNAVVEGPLVFEREVKLYVHASARIGELRGATAVRYDGASPPKE